MAKDLHHSESPSHYNAWQYCGSWESEDRQSGEAREGTRVHSELQKLLTSPDYDSDSYVARRAHEWIATNEMGVHNLEAEVKLEGTMEDVEGIYGTADAKWFDDEGRPHFFDLKTFSDGSEDYIPQLQGYVALWLTNDLLAKHGEVYLHVYHGGVCKCETFVCDTMDAYMNTVHLLKAVRSGGVGRAVNKYCQYCKLIKECPMSNQAVQVVSGGGSVDFSKMSLPQKLVVCETVEKLIKKLKDDAKQQAIDNGGVLEADGIRYVIKTKNGKGRVHDLLLLSRAFRNGVYVNNKNGEPVMLKPLSDEALLDLCELPKGAFTKAVQAENADCKDVTKKSIEDWCKGQFDEGNPIQYLAREK